MKKIFALVAVFLTIGFVIGAGTRSFSQVDQQHTGAVGSFAAQSIVAADEIASADKTEKGCCWDGLCANANHCHHSIVTAFTAAFSDAFVEPVNDGSFNAISDRLPRLSLHYALIDPPRA